MPISPEAPRFFKTSLPNSGFKTASLPSQTTPTVSERSWLSLQCGEGMARAPGVWKMAYGPATVLTLRPWQMSRKKSGLILVRRLSSS